jgi:uncharacterized protein YggT (Ycf19 family)
MNIFLFQFINYTLSFLMWMILGRILLTLMIGNRDMVFSRMFQKVTEPVYLVVRKVLPFVKESCVPFVSVLVIVILRLVLIILFTPPKPQ